MCHSASQPDSGHPQCGRSESETSLIITVAPGRPQWARPDEPVRMKKCGGLQMSGSVQKTALSRIVLPETVVVPDPTVSELRNTSAKVRASDPLLLTVSPSLSSRNPGRLAHPPLNLTGRA